MRLILFILIFAIFLAFIVFNLDNKCDISVGFMTFKETPVFLSAFFSFIAGMVFAVPLVFSFGRKRKKPSIPESPDKAPKEIQYSGTDEVTKEKSPYGID